MQATRMPNPLLPDSALDPVDGVVRAHDGAFGRTDSKKRRMQRVAEGTIAVAIWIGLGFAFHLSAHAYLLLGIPITVIFQRYVRRTPLLAMWVREAPPVRVDTAFIGTALGFTALPAVLVILVLRAFGASQLVLVGWLCAAMVGALGAAYAVKCSDRSTYRELLRCLTTAGSLGIAIFAITAIRSTTHSGISVGLRALIGSASFVQYIPAVFVLEEVWFRGVLDAHIHHAHEDRGLASAAYVSALWGLWHVPILGVPPSVGGIVQLLLVHVPIGIFLSHSWRRSGNLIVPGTVHALIDGVRDALA